MKRKILALALAVMLPGMALAVPPALTFTKLWTHGHGATVGQVSEIPAFDKRTNTLWVAGVVGVDVLDGESGALVEHIDTTPYGSVNSVAIKNGLAAFAIEAAHRSDPGVVVFYDTRTRSFRDDLGAVVVGALPDMLTFTPDGSRLLVANEATPSVYGALDPAGSVSIIDLATHSVVTAGFAGVPRVGDGVRSGAGMDFEPEYIAVNEEGTQAFVTLQEANALGVLDLASQQFTAVVGLGLKDFSLASNGFGGSNFIDPSDKDNLQSLRASAVKGLYQPDGIAAYQVKGRTYLVMANEGDTREDDGDKKRVKDVAALSAAAPADLQRLNVSTVDSAPGALVTFGARSFSIRDEAGRLVYDSGNVLDAEAIKRGIYDDGRSDDKGVEPEGVALLDIAGRTFAFIGLERTTQAAVAVFDITDPAAAGFVDMIVTEGDVSPEGLTAYHYRGEFYLAIANEVSSTTTLYRLDAQRSAPRGGSRAP